MNRTHSRIERSFTRTIRTHIGGIEPRPFKHTLGNLHGIRLQTF